MELEVEHFPGTTVLVLASGYTQHNTVQHKCSDEVEKRAWTVHQSLIQRGESRSPKTSKAP